MNTEKYLINNKKELRIAISGPSGCGNTTVSTMLAQILEIECINYTFRNLAEEMKIPFSKILKEAQTDFSFDKAVDKKQIELALKKSCVLGSRLAIWLLENADLKIYLTAGIDVRSKRIYKREGGNLEKIKEATVLRDSEDTRRYKELYGIDNKNFNFADIIIDTEKNTPEEIIDIILKALIKFGLISKL